MNNRSWNQKRLVFTLLAMMGIGFGTAILVGVAAPGIFNTVTETVGVTEVVWTAVPGATSALASSAVGGNEAVRTGGGMGGSGIPDSRSCRMELDLSDIRRIEIECEAADVLIESAAPDSESSDALRRLRFYCEPAGGDAAHGSDMQLSPEVRNDVLRILCRPQEGRFYGTADRDRLPQFVALVPSEFRGEIAVRTHLGKIAAAGDYRTGDYTSEAGAIEVHGTYETLSASSELGKITLRGSADDLRLKTGVGMISADLTQVGPGTVRLDSEMGSIRLGLPSGADLDGVAIEVKNSLGKVRSVHPLSPPGTGANWAATLIYIQCEVGRVDVEYIETAVE